MEQPKGQEPKAKLSPEEAEMVKAGLESIEAEALLTGDQVREIARARTQAWKSAKAPKKSA